MYLTWLLSPGCRWGRFQFFPITIRPFPDCTIGQEPLQPCPLLAGFSGAWCGCSILPVKEETFLKIDDLKTELIENWLRRLLRADKLCRHDTASCLRRNSVEGRYRIAGKSRDLRVRKGCTSFVIFING